MVITQQPLGPEKERERGEKWAKMLNCQGFTIFMCILLGLKKINVYLINWQCVSLLPKAIATHIVVTLTQQNEY
jgi:hypothetical protein